MLKRFVLCVLFGSIAAVHAEVSPYLSLSGGVAFMNDLRVNVDGSRAGTVDMKEGFTGEAAAGLALRPVRIEAAYIMEENDSDRFQEEGSDVWEDVDGTLNVSAVMLNGYLDLTGKDPTAGSIVPFILAGVGYATVDDDDIESDSVAYQFGLGAGYNITQHFILDLKYRYFWTEYEASDAGSTIKTDIESSSILLGVRYQF